ncbi:MULTISPECIES: gamma carbonic anhydrase family protein [Sporomusa]|jgi:carbonic anhydrase/acetyltransferase-like protein (isoleucine patch superfamily)|uniref:gamma carbonic anhydrase family protein n=1 Tax=Sporomusa TaxID=2375 RepID=UPI00166801F8|nr:MULTISPECIES: gamma carbonic anhydrase family protein [Sporomusa]MCM0757090.1 gamma carbonic anhydrase family protein [Sporomusa sphaeroides DSM 2875]HML34454.1 gamma carbonic anhydrase family protein [Sporomusa sphaeroides]
MLLGSVIPFKGLQPTIDNNVFIAEGARVIGDVSIEAHASIWFNTVLRGDVQPIRIGRYTNIQDNCTVHVWYEFPTVIGNYVTVGHGAILHGCTIASNCLIGMGAIILNYAEIGENCIIGAGALIPERKKIPPNSLVMGSPGKVIRQVSMEEIETIRQSALVYAQDAKNYMV